MSVAGSAGPGRERTADAGPPAELQPGRDCFGDARGIRVEGHLDGDGEQHRRDQQGAQSRGKQQQPARLPVAVLFRTGIQLMPAPAVRPDLRPIRRTPPWRRFGRCQEAPVFQTIFPPIDGRRDIGAPGDIHQVEQRLYSGVKWGLSRSMRIRSAHFPGSTEPISRSRPRTFAPSMVAIRRTVPRP